MRKVHRNDVVMPMLTEHERLIQFIVDAVREKNYNLAKLFISHDLNLIGAFYNIQYDYFRSLKPLKGLNPGLMASLYHQEIRRITFENAINKQIYLCFCDLSEEFVAAIRKYAEEQFVNPSMPFKKNIEAMYQQFINGRKQKLINTLLDMYNARIGENSEAEVWFNNRCFSLRREGKSYVLSLQGMAHYTKELNGLVTNEKELEIITLLQNDCEQRDMLIQRQFTNDVIDPKTESFQELNRILIRIYDTSLKLKNLTSIAKGPMFHYLTQGSSVGLAMHDEYILKRFDDLVKQYFPLYDFKMSHSNNLKRYKKFSDTIMHLHDELLDNNTEIGMHHDLFLSKMLPLNDQEKAKLRKFLKSDVLSLEMVGDLGSRVLDVNDILDIKGNNLLHILFESYNIHAQFLLFLIDRGIDIFAINAERRRPITDVVVRCIQLPFSIYKKLIMYSIEYIRRLKIPNVDANIRAIKLVLDILFSEVTSYVERKHLIEVQKLNNKEPGLFNMTRKRAQNIAELLCFFNDHYSESYRGTLTKERLKEFVEKVKSSIETVLSDRRSELYRIMEMALNMIDDPRNLVIDKQAEIVETLTRKIVQLDMAFSQALDRFEQRMQNDREDNQKFMKQMTSQQQDFMRELFSKVNTSKAPGGADGSPIPDERRYSPRFKYSEQDNCKPEDFEADQKNPKLSQNYDDNVDYTVKAGDDEIYMPAPIEGLIFTKIPGDGHCFYRAVCLYLNLEVPKLRQMVAQYINDNIGEFMEIISAINPNMTPEQYLNRIERGDEWADDLEINVLRRILNRPIVILGPDGIIRDGSNFYRGDSPIFVQYNGHNHYDALVLSDSKSGRKILEDLIESVGSPKLN